MEFVFSFDVNRDEMCLFFALHRRLDESTFRHLQLLRLLAQLLLRVLEDFRLLLQLLLSVREQLIQLRTHNDDITVRRSVRLMNQCVQKLVLIAPIKLHTLPLAQWPSDENRTCYIVHTNVSIFYYKQFTLFISFVVFVIFSSSSLMLSIC